MLNDITRIVSYEEIIQILDAGCKKNQQFNPTSSDYTIYVDLAGKVRSSAISMANYCKNNDIPFTIEGDDLLCLRVRTMRDTKAEDRATSYMRNKCPEWDGSWNSEFIGFVMGWGACLRQKTNTDNTPLL